MTSKLCRSLSLPFAFAALSAVFGCSGGGEEETNPAPGKSRTIDIKAEEYKFTPSQIAMAPGERVTISLRNQGKMEHGLEFETPGNNQSLGRSVAPGMTANMTFDAPSKTGSYKFYSPVDDDRKNGMEGRLEVISSGTTRHRR